PSRAGQAGRRSRDAGSAQRERRGDGVDAFRAVAVRPATTAVNAASSASSGAPRTTRRRTFWSPPTGSVGSDSVSSDTAHSLERTPSQGDVAVLLRWQGLALVAQHPQRPGDVA